MAFLPQRNDYGTPLPHAPAAEARDEIAALWAALDCIPEGVGFVDAEGILTGSSRRFRTLLGLPEDQPLDGVALAEASGGALTLPNIDDTSVLQETVVRPGIVLDVRFHRQAAGRWICALSDVTAQRATETRLQDSEDLLRETLDSVDASIVVYDENDRYVLANRSYHDEHWHLPDDTQLAGKSFEQLLRITMRAGQLREGQAGADPEGFVARRLAERRALRDKGYERRYACGRWDLVRTRRTPSGKRVTLRVDITEQKRLQAELQRARAATEALSAAKSQFLAMMSHELRTPLNPIIGFADIMRRQLFGPLSERYVGYAEDIHCSSTHLLALLGDVLDLSRIEADRMPLHDEPIDTPGLLEELVPLFGDKAAEQGTTLEVAAPRDLPRLTADLRLVRQMTLNLLSNAVKFTQRGRITASAGMRPDGGLTVAVADTGIGIPADALERIGEPFFQPHAGLSRDKGGSGLGLALVREMMAKHGGSFTVESREGAGTTISLNFPPSRTLAVPKDRTPANR